METLFENSYIKNREWAKDVFGYINFRRPLIIVFDIYFFMCVVLGIVDIIVDKNINTSKFLYRCFNQVFAIFFNRNICLYA